MRKRIIGQGPRYAAAEQDWMDLERLAQVEITSEEVDYPIESALIPGTGSGWRAAQPGEQTIRLLFDEPLRLRRIYLVFHEDEQERTQEFVLRWSPDGGQSYREILRQQYNFSPPEAAQEFASGTAIRVVALLAVVLGGFLGGLLPARKAEGSYLLNGLLTGLGVAILFVVYIIVTGSSFSPIVLLWAVLAITAGVLGGWVGGRAAEAEAYA